VLYQNERGNQETGRHRIEKKEFNTDEKQRDHEDDAGIVPR
jgi:hypothetical protein